MTPYIHSDNHQKGVEAMEYLAKFQQFTNSDELNEAVSSHIARCLNELTDTNIDVLYTLNAHATEYPGVAHVKLTTIANSINRSRRTAQRSVRKLEQLRIITRRPIAQRTGAQDANLYTFLP